VRLVKPRTLDIGKVAEECERLSAIAKALSNKSVGETEADMVSKKLAL